MTPEEFAQSEDAKDLKKLQIDIAKALDGYEVYLSLAAIFSVFISLVELSVVDKVTFYKQTIKTLIKIAKEHQEKK